MLKALLNAHAYFSFGAGCSSPTTLVKRAAELGYTHIALTDTLGVYGTVELIGACKEYGPKPILGASIPFTHKGKTYPVTLLCSSKCGYETLNRLITLAKESEEERLTLSTLEAYTTDLHCLTGGRKGFLNSLIEKRNLSEAEYILAALKAAFKDRLWVQLFFDCYPWDMRRARALRSFAREHGVPVVIAPEVRYATPDLMPLHDALFCGREGITLQTPHEDRPLNDCQAIPDPTMFPLHFEDAIHNTNTLAEKLTFELLPDRLSPPPAVVPDGYDPQTYLEMLCREALLEAYKGAKFREASERLDKELYTLKSLGFADFFLVCKEVMDFCKSRGIVASGRGSAAGSIVCYLLGITQADPVEHGLLFERFLHGGKRSMPDVDIDIASSRRREVFDWVEERFPNAAIVCNRVTYKLSSAIKDIGRALGLPAPLTNHLTQSLGRDYKNLRPHKAKQAQPIFDEVLGKAPVKVLMIELLEKMEKGFVREVSPHSGGWVMSRYPLSSYSPQERSSGGLLCLQFDKDDIERLGLMKLDLLSLRMLGAFEWTREEVYRTEGVLVDCYNPPDDPAIWKTLHSGDTMTLFQIESPAQTHTTVRLKPETRQDLKVQVALVRPGPIQSNSVHPYMRRRKGREPVTYIHPSLEPVLERTFGVLLYQEQVMQVAHHFAGFDWEAADRFRKKVSTFEDEHEVRRELRQFTEGAKRTVGATAEEARKVFQFCASFRGYGFAESHAHAFGAHAYTSAWLRYHYPAEYLAGIMTEQPGMYETGTLRQEAERRGVGFARLDINKSSYHYYVEKVGDRKRLRPPLSAVEDVSVDVAKQLVLERLMRGPFLSLRDLFERIALDWDVMEALDRAGAFEKFVDRREGLYQVGVLAQQGTLGQGGLFAIEEAPPFPELSTMERLEWDFELKGYSEHPVHPVDLRRNELLELGAVPFSRLHRTSGYVRTAGLVVAKQKPPTAKGFAFWLLEDNTQRMQVVIHPDLWDEKREVLRDSQFLMTEGNLSREGQAWTLRAEGLWAI